MRDTEKGPEDIQIRRMQYRDVPQVAALEKATFARPWSEQSFHREVEENPVARYLVAVRDGRIVGYAGAWVVMDECHITNIAVAEEERGRGLGKRLLGGLLQYMSSLGAAWADLEVRVSNERAQRLYRGAGFVSIGKRKRYYEDNGEDAFLMVCEHLPPADPDFSEEPVEPEESAPSPTEETEA